MRKQKNLTFCLSQRFPLYAQAYCQISSYLQAIANNGTNPLVAIQKVLEGKIPATEAGGKPKRL